MVLYSIEQQLLKYVRIAAKAKGPKGQILLQLLERRLDNILFRLGMAPIISEACQLVNHRHILVNGRIVHIPSYHRKPRDTVWGLKSDIRQSNLLICEEKKEVKIGQCAF